MLTRLTTVIIFFLCTMAQTSVRAQSLIHFGFIPENWRSEVISFPLDFAPSLDYEGRLELLFSPGMFDDKSEEFLSYGFVWAIENNDIPAPNKLARDLETYYYGLQIAVSENKLVTKTKGLVSADQNLSNGDLTYKGVIEWIEPFVTQKAQKLHLTITFYRDEDQSRWLGFFRVSPQEPSHPIWNTLDDLPIKLD